MNLNHKSLIKERIIAQQLLCITTYTQRSVHETNVILQYKLLAAILSAVCSVIQQS